METSETFLEIGKNYLIRTVTMIYTGKLVAVNKTELLLSNCCWIAETDTWAQCLESSSFREVEPYPAKLNVIVARGGISDVCELLAGLPTKQK